MSDFWTRRRAAVEAEARAEEVALIDTEEAAREAEVAEQSDEDLLAEAGLPEPETLTRPEEVQDFLRSALPQRLKTRALRRLWRLNPVLANVDGLVDYGEDFTDAATVIPDLKTVYRVGKGMIAKLEELGAAEEAGASAPPDEAAPLSENPSPTDVEIDAVSVAPPAATPASYSQTDDDPVSLPATHRRMQFDFSQAPDRKGPGLA